MRGFTTKTWRNGTRCFSASGCARGHRLFDDRLALHGYDLGMDLEEIIKLEMKLLDPSIRKNAEELNSLLSPGFVEFGTSGRIYNRKIVVEQLAQETPPQIEALDFQGIFLAPEVVQLRFKTRRTNPDGTVSASLRSSIW